MDFGPLAEQLYPGGVRRKRICTVVFCQKHLEELDDCQRPFKNYLQSAKEGDSSQVFQTLSTVSKNLCAILFKVVP
jgi:hypothetical protein